jgi:hypothetical protein
MTPALKFAYVVFFLSLTGLLGRLAWLVFTHRGRPDYRPPNTTATRGGTFTDLGTIQMGSGPGPGAAEKRKKLGESNDGYWAQDSRGLHCLSCGATWLPVVRVKEVSVFTCPACERVLTAEPDE